MPKVKLTNSLVKEISSNLPEKETDYIDQIVPGLLLRYRNSRLSWQIRYSFNGRQRRMKLGEFEALNLSEAKKLAVKSLNEIALGNDPLEQKSKADVMRLSQLCDKWHQTLIDTKKSASYLKDTRKITEDIKTSFLSQKPLTEITPEQIEKFLQPYYEEKPYHHNRIRSAFVAMFKLAVKYRYLEISPATNLVKAPEQSRDDVLTESQFSRIVKACYEVGTPPAYAILLMCYTGCRPSDAFRARWSGFDLRAGTWRREATQTKQKKTQIVELSDNAISLISDIVPRSDEVFLFPSDSKTGHILTARKTWSSVCKLASVNATMYTIRKYVATMILKNGGSVKDLQAIMAWESPLTPLKHYAKVHKGEGRKQLNKIFTNLDHN